MTERQLDEMNDIEQSIKADRLQSIEQLSVIEKKSDIAYPYTK